MTTRRMYSHKTFAEKNANSFLDTTMSTILYIAKESDTGAHGNQMGILVTGMLGLILVQFFSLLIHTN